MSNDENFTDLKIDQISNEDISKDKRAVAFVIMTMLPMMIDDVIVAAIAIKMMVPILKSGLRLIDQRPSSPDYLSNSLLSNYFEKRSQIVRFGSVINSIVNAALN
ncbi:hypothetical protein BpHYR1_054416 [Brachionus plicatilis]|uniref:Uncharacterized protein n=1 Tax=Brachionus plicatilis TaxID=10195 RepID=A0A3M7PXD5_BRAPC|nr:hypothetical protein BpHYR1_054416 [Brachionus plicatilis]